MDNNIILPILQKIPLFADLNEQEHQEIIKNIVLNYYPVGYTFFLEGDTNGGMYIMKHGMVRITKKEPAGEDRELAALSDNDFFGEMSLVLSEPRNATAIAITDCEVFELKKEDFVKLMETSPTMANKISTEFLNRVKKNSKQL
ncbi:MAG: cyclic nucleotide-binding domain-containing protein [Patescibacteria group bacterium]